MVCTTVLVDGAWAEAEEALGTFQSFDPATGEPHPGSFPIVGWNDLERMAMAAEFAARELGEIEPERIARFLDRFADLIEENARQICEAASSETSLPAETRLAGIELPRTTGQLRQAANAARDISPNGWSMPCVDVDSNIRSRFEPLGGAVLVIGPNNFPLAFNAISGGDFAAAIAAGNPVIAKGHPAHPETTRLLADAARAAVEEVGLPSGTVQCFFHAPPDDIARLIAHPGLAAVAFTGGKTAGLAVKAAADAAGKTAYLEMSSLNPVVLMPDAAASGIEDFAEQWAGSIRLGSGQFCTKPGLCFVVGEDTADVLGEAVTKHFDGVENGVLLSSGLVEVLDQGVRVQQDAGAILLSGGVQPEEPGFRYPPTLLLSNGSTFLEMPDSMQRELFGPAAMIVACRDEDQLCTALRSMRGQLTACIWTTGGPECEELFQNVRSILRPICGRLLENKMPTGVAVVESMVHGGPFPATAPPGFTSIGIPASMRRFAALRCYDGVPSSHLPAALT
jgi:NADP-dependent aldehyde dehydrogenase